MEKFLKFISSFDYFGHYVVYTFNKQGDNVHRTSFGGFVSILMNIVMVVYVVFLLIRMITRQYDYNYEYNSAWNNGDDWTQNWYYWNTMNMFLTMQIYDTSSNTFIDYDQSKYKQYFSIYTDNYAYNSTYSNSMFTSISPAGRTCK